MAVSPEILFSPRLKVERARRHIEELRRMSSPLSRELYSVTLESREAPARPPFAKGSLGQTVVYRPLKPIPETFALIIGDASHNLRSALDHLSTAIVRTHKPSAAINFPMRKTRQEFVVPNKSLKETLDLLEQALPGTTKLFLDEIRVDGGPQEPLWAFNSLDNDDKHNLLIPTVTIASIVTPLITVGSNTMMPGGIVGNDAMRTFHLVTSYGLPIVMRGEFSTSVEIRFGQGAVFGNDPVLPTLGQIAGLVTDTLDKFEALIRNTP